MDNLDSYFLYNADDINMSEVFDQLSRNLKFIHSNNQVVGNISSSSIIFDGNNFIFGSVEETDNFARDKRRNLISLAKLVLGGYLTGGNGINNFVEADDNWFIQNIDSICDNITADDFNSDYFYSLFEEGSDEYYCDYLQRKKQNEALGGKGNTNAYKKVLTNAASGIYSAPAYEEYEEDEVSTIEKKSAQITPIFYPLLIGISLATVITMYIIFKYL